jgi:hypothetical protein
MMDAHDHQHDEAMPNEWQVSFPGPFQHHDVVVNGWAVPLLHAHPHGEDRVRIVLDDRLGVDLSADEAERLLPFVADAIAVALGYGAHPGKDMVALPERTPQAAPRRAHDVVLDEAV